MELFEQIDTLPKQVKSIVEKYEVLYMEGSMNYEKTGEYLKELEEVGYTFDYGLDNEPYDLRPLTESSTVQTITIASKPDGIIAELCYDLIEVPNTVYIKSVWVAPDHRKKGIAKDMLLDLLNQHKGKSVMLDCTKTSKKVWTKMGFRFKGITSKMKVEQILNYNK